MMRFRRLCVEQLESRSLLAGHGDFNGDGFDDLAIGIPGEDVGMIENAGAVSVIYGRPRGLRATGNQLWHQDVEGIDGIAAENERFGSALAIGDFNNDGFDDLAIGVVGEAVAGRTNAGAVNIIYGSRRGLRSTGDQLWTQNSTGINDQAELEDRFGFALAAGDFDGDGRDDLAIGAPGEMVGMVAAAGGVAVIYGTAGGLNAAGDQLWNQESTDINDMAEADDEFGSALAAGDFNDDGRHDLAIGVPKESIAGADKAGAVHVVYGSTNGLATTNNQLWHQDVQDVMQVPNITEADDFFGAALVVGRFDGDRFDDLAIGIPGEDNTGAVQILKGSSGRLTPTPQIIRPDDLGFINGPDFQFGSSLATGNFDNDRFDDLAIGASAETVGVNATAGAVYVAYGSMIGLGAADLPDQRWVQGVGPSGTLGDEREAGDLFGASLTAGDYDGDGRSDLAIGAPGETFDGHVGVGVVHVVYGTRLGLSDFGDDLWHQGLFSAADGNEEGDSFGAALA